MPAKVTKIGPEPRSYTVVRNNQEYRRNRRDLLPSKVQTNPDVADQVATQKVVVNHQPTPVVPTTTPTTTRNESVKTENKEDLYSGKVFTRYGREVCNAKEVEGVRKFVYNVFYVCISIIW